MDCRYMIQKGPSRTVLQNGVVDLEARLLICEIPESWQKYDRLNLEARLTADS